jgi:hypothetical protein
VRHGGVPAGAIHRDDECIGRRIHGAGPRIDPSDLEVIPQVETKARVRAWLERALGEHSFSAADALFSWLEHERDGPRQLAPARDKKLGCRQQDRGMAIMAAGVVGALIHRLVGLAPISLGEGERIHVGTQHDCATGPAAPEYAHDPGLAHARTHLVKPELLQTLGDDPGRSMFLVRQLRMAVKIPPQLDQSFALLGGQH